MGAETKKEKVKAPARQTAPKPGLRPLVPVLLLLAAVLAAYANHFENSFHFDDGHTIVQNPNIRSLRNIPRFFTNAALFSSMPGNASYRPAVSTSLAIDYWLSRGLEPFGFHISTFVWFSVELVLIFLLFRRIMDMALPHAANLWIALFAAALYGLHPANAETVNYIIQRADLYNALGTVASLWLFAAYPEQRNRLWYLLPAVVAFLAKPPALIFPLILIAYIWLFERDRTSLRAALPALAVTIAAGLLIWKMTPESFDPAAKSPSLYRLTQPWATLYYFRSFFLPISLNADAGWDFVPGAFSLEALAGYLFVAALVAVAIYTARRRETRPIAFGLVWFILALLPVALMPLADVMNDHRMFFPFVGLTLAAVWAVRLAAPAYIASPRMIVAAAGVVLIAAAMGTHMRNNVWRTEESLWRDSIDKNPDNSRALAGYGRALVMRGAYAEGLPYLERAQARGNYPELEIDMGMTNAHLGRDEAAAQHFERAIALAPNNPRAYYFYGYWLKQKGRLAESRAQVNLALGLNPVYLDAHELLKQLNTAQDESIGMMPGESISPEGLLNQSAEDCKNGRYKECLDEALQALKRRPAWAEAYGNMSAALLGMQRWDEGIEAAQRALRLKPDYQAARKNLQWALEHKPK